MSVTIKSIDKKSIAAKAGIVAGDVLLSVNGHEINDVLDYKFYTADSSLTIRLHDRIIKIKKDEYDDLGLVFDTYLMDEQKNCKNKCIFCFIDQLPKGMRDTLYFKDDDSRMSFLYGNYITLTNLTDTDAERIIKMKIPLNISVHTTNEKLREKMMGRKGTNIHLLKKFAEANIRMNTQIVLCPGINDGKELKKTLTDLCSLYPSVQSIAVVPAGLTKHREGLEPLIGFTKETAEKVIKIINDFGEKNLDKHGTRICFAADELYLKAKQNIPEAEYYEDYPQIENGVGMLKSFIDEFVDEMRNSECGIRNEENETQNIVSSSGNWQLATGNCCSVATGTAAFPFIKSLIDMAEQKWHNIKCNIFPIKNDFFGHTVTVAGLVTGGDLINQLKDKNLGEKLLIPSTMLRYEQDVFLDNITISEVEKELNIKVEIVPVDGREFLKSLLNIK